MNQTAIQEQIDRRRQRALEEQFKIGSESKGRLFTTYDVRSPSGRAYKVTLRSVTEQANTCDCPDFRTNLLGTCKHVEATLILLKKRLKKRLPAMASSETSRARVYLSHRRELEIRLTPVHPDGTQLGRVLSRFFDGEGALIGDPLERFGLLEDALQMLPVAERRGLAVEEDIREHLREARERRERLDRRDWFLNEVREGRRSVDLISTKLYSYQVEGLLHLALGERAMLADDMGLGKTIQAIAAATLLRELRGIQRVLIVTPASLKHQWEREIHRFTSLSTQIIQGISARRELIYSTPAFFTIVNYELLLRERDIFKKLSPDLVILDEAQRIKNWRTKTAQAVKELESRYAFVLSGTPLENKLDELYSVMQFLDPRILGPLWRFNSEFYVLQKRKTSGFKVLGHQNLGQLRERIKPVVLRRTREEVIQELPERVDNTFFVEMTTQQLEPYASYKSMVAGLAQIAERRPLTPQEHKRLMMGLQKMRILCDALVLHDPKISVKETLESAPKLAELERVLDELVVQGGRKAILFSSFEGMIDLAIEHVVKKMKLGYEKLAGSVPTERRGRLLERFREDDACKLLLSTDAGGVGLNLQEASLVVNLDMPWNPAVLEQRIGRAHRLGQKRSVQVVNLVARGVLEERMLDTLATKRHLFASVFDPAADIDQITFDRSSGLLARVRDWLQPAGTQPPAAPGQPPALPPAQDAGTQAGSALALPPAAEAPGRTSAPATGEAATGSSSAESGLAAAPPTSRADRAKNVALHLAEALPGRVLLVREWTRPGETRPGLLVVVDQDPSGAATVLEARLQELWTGPDVPQLHLFDRVAYVTLAAMLGLTVDDEDGEAFRSPALPRQSAPRADRKKDEARRSLETARERLRLARLLLGNGFGGDAFTPLGEALDHGLRGLLSIHAPASQAAPDVLSVERFLVRPGHLKPEASARIAWVKSLEAAPDLAEPAAAAVEEILAQVTAALDG